MKIKSLYIHIPFCDHICIYCDFYKMIAKDEIKSKYINYLIKELEIRKDYLTDLETIYLGGGTPSNLKLNDLNRLLESISNHIDLRNIKEFTIECNPKDVTSDFLKIIKNYKINRISLGVQSLNKEKLNFLNRNHQENDVKNAINLIHEYGFNNINCDLIYGVNNDTIDLIKYDIDTLIKLGIKHLSCYSLIIEDKTILNKFIKEKKYKPLDDDKDFEIYDFLCKYLNSLGLKQYEISNYACPGFESIHNLTYWNLEYYMGLGANSSYYYNHTRFTNIDNLDKYFKSIDFYNVSHDLIYKTKEELTLTDETFEFIMLGLRKIKGINELVYNERFKRDIFKDYPNINKLIKDGFLEYKNNIIVIKSDKLYIMNQIINKILD